MTAIALLLLLGQQSIATAESSTALRCLPARDGFLSMRLRGGIEEDVDWREPALECAGMSRPDGRGLRLRFAGTRAGGELAVVFAAPELGMGVSGRAVPVNVTVLDGAGERIYGTQGESRCVFDEVEQRALADESLPARSYRVTARGFCVAPARALDGDGSVLLTRFDFAGLVTYDDDEGAASELFPNLQQARIQIATASGTHRFDVWIAANEESQQRGLMFVRELPRDRGMLFIFDTPREAAFWMKNTYLSLDLIFIDPAGTVLNIEPNARPQTLDPIESRGPAKAVLELPAGTARKIGLAPGDRITLPSLQTTWSPATLPDNPSSISRTAR